jgi:outer membrane receptor protein involved in Fe transport
MRIKASAFITCKSLSSILLLLLSCGYAHAQGTASGALSGTVADNNQAVIRGATVTAINKDTNLVRTSTTDESGEYKIDLLPAGIYEVKINASGFGDYTASKVEVLIGRNTDIPVTMTPAAQTVNINITGNEGELISREKTDVGLNITPRQVEELPINGRDFGSLAILAPGAKPVDSYDPTKSRIAIFAVNGSSGRNVNVTVNGVDNKDNTVGGPVMQLPLEAVQEFVISTQRFSAANGRSEGAAVNVVTKSGGNQFHGSLFFFTRERWLNANDFFSKQGDQPKPPFSRHQSGGSIGGPLFLPRFGEGGPAAYKLQRKTFFFFALERQSEATTIPVDPNAFTELSLAQSLGAQPVRQIPIPYNDLRVNARIDHTFNQKHNMFVSYTDQSNKGLNDQSTSTNDLTAGNFTTNRLQIANVTLNSVLSSRVVNSATVGYQYWNNLIDTNLKVPTVFFNGGITFGTNSNVPQQSYQTKYQFKDDISLSRGKHTYRTGIDYVSEPKLGGFFEFNPTPEFDFFDNPSVILSNRGKYPQGFSTPGAIQAISATAGDPYFNLPGGVKMFGVYFQDDWKVRRNITLNLGVRYDKDFNLIGTNVQAKNRTYLALKAINHPAASRLPHDDSRNFSPRVGFAWDIKGTGKQIIRGGYGLYYGQTFLNIPLFMIQQINPTIFATVLSLSSGGIGDPNADVVPGTGGILLSNYRFGIDPLPTIPPASATLGAGATGRIIAPEYRNPYTQQWNIGYALQLNNASAIEIEYVHTLGLHESKTLNLNPKIASLGGIRPLSAAFRAAGAPVLGRIDEEASVGRSRYDGLNVSYRRRLSNHFSLNTNYVLSKAVAYNGSPASFRARPTDPFDYFAKHDFGPAPNDTRHRFVLSGLVNLPLGFQFAPILQLESARPYTAIQGNDVYGVGNGRGNAHVILQTANPNDLLATRDLSTSALRACLASGQCFQAPFDNLRGKPFFQLDTRVSKNFKIREKTQLTLLFQAFDLTNRANFGNTYDGNIQDSTFRQPNGFITPNGVIIPHSFSGEIGVRLSF